MITTRQFSTNEIWNDYCNWLIANGAFIHESLTLPPDSKSSVLVGWRVHSNP